MVDVLAIPAIEPGPPAPAKALLMMPCTRGHSGEALEQISLTRDELANLAWAVQRRVTNSEGDPVELPRPSGWAGTPPTLPEVRPDPAFPAYRVETTVPELPVPAGARRDGSRGDPVQPGTTQRT